MTMKKRSTGKSKAEPTGRWVRGNRTQITLSIAPELLAQVDAIAQRKHLSRAALMTVWLGEKVEQDEREHERQ
jgi:metal-responsive CopG/Arc/MetJ family transcriptional regulator